jgi:hypothetical protein
MKLPSPLTAWVVLLATCCLLGAGCTTTFSQHDAREVTRDKLLRISEAGTTDHLQYVGSDFDYHYVYDARDDKHRSYKIRIDSLALADTFPVGDDSYVLRPWVIEGKPMGTKPTEMPKDYDGVPEEEGTSDWRKRKWSRVGGAAQPVVQRPAEANVGEEPGDDQVEPAGIETP